LPQWNCACANCCAARAGKIPAQTQSSIAIAGEDSRWFLINASPDLARQIEAVPALQPSAQNPRNTPIAAVLLTNADIDHALGLLTLRQQENPIVVYASEATRTRLQWLDGVMARFCGIEWRAMKDNSLGENFASRSIELKQSAAFQISDKTTGVTVLIAPAVAELTKDLEVAAQNSDAVFFDGTFWRDDELQSVRPGARTAKQMHHLPVSDGSLEFLRSASARRKIYIHINNTNPMLMPGSPEDAAVKAAGIEIAYDGLELEL
jgi:pyrroloquinoline quinone biosynthesis protein B